MSNLICVSIIDGQYLHIDSETLRKSSGRVLYDSNFNEKKFYDLVSKFNSVITVVGIIKDYGKVLGFITCDVNGELDTIDSEVLKSMLYMNQKGCTNYSVVMKNGKISLRKSPNFEFKDFTLDEVNDLMGYEKKELNPMMSIDEIQEVMNYYGFKLGVDERCDYEVEPDVKKIGRYLLYYNQNGFLISVPYLDNHINNSVFPVSMWCIRKVNSRKFDMFLGKRPQIIKSFKRLGENNSNIVEFAVTDMKNFFKFVEEAEKFSIPCSPFYLGTGMKTNLLNMVLTPEEKQRAIDIIWKEKSVTDAQTAAVMAIAAIAYAAYKKLDKLPKDLQELYEEYRLHLLTNMKKWCKIKGITKEEYELALKLVDYLM